MRTRSAVFKLLAIVCFVIAFFVAQTWFTKGDWTEWIAAGLAFLAAGLLFEDLPPNR